MEGGPAGHRFGVSGASLLLQPLFSGGGARRTTSLEEALEVGAVGHRFGCPVPLFCSNPSPPSGRSQGVLFLAESPRVFFVVPGPSS